jgi:hypothetical protein
MQRKWRAHAKDLCTQARVDDAEFEVVEGDGGGAKRGVTPGRGSAGGGADSASITMIQSSNSNSIAAGSDLARLFFIFQKLIFHIGW